MRAEKLNEPHIRRSTGLWIIGKYLDDLLYCAGLTALVIGAFKFCDIAGWVVLGLGLIALSLLIARN